MLLTYAQQSVLDYCIFCYGGTYQFDGDFIRIYVETDEFYINVKDKARFGLYHIYHRNNQELKRTGERHFHRQTRANHLSHAFFLCFTHLFNKRCGIFNQPGDFSRFQEDAVKYFPAY
jgi:hypothetical protein